MPYSLIIEFLGCGGIALYPAINDSLGGDPHGNRFDPVGNDRLCGMAGHR
jgi:hypothetical protein